MEGILVRRKKLVGTLLTILCCMVDFFGNSRKYTKVGEVKRAKGWETKGPAPTLCARAQEGRGKRARPEGK